jgi:iron complex outermembrane recepter protein
MSCSTIRSTTPTSSDPEAVQAGAKPLTALASCTSTNPAVAGGNALCDTATGQVQRPQDLSGNSLPQAPRNKVALAVTYTWEFEAGSLTPEVSYIWRDKQYGGLFERAYNAAPSWDQTDFRLSWKGKDNKYSIIAFVKNAFDQLGYDGGSSSQRLSGVFNAATIAAGGVVPGLPSTAPGAFNGVQRGGSFNGITTNYNLTPPRTFGVELQYRF